MKKTWTSFCLILLTLAVYAPALRNGFVWQDEALILRDPLIRSWHLIGEGFAHFLYLDAGPSEFYRPVLRLSYTLDYAAFHFSPFGYHLMSILWHAAAAVAFFCFAEEFLSRAQLEERRRVWSAFLAALVWAIHPVQSEAVVYVAGRADSLAALFGFLGLYLGMRMLRASGNGRWAFGVGAGLCLLASALSKELGLIFLALWLLLAIGLRPRAASLGALALVLAVLVAYGSLRLTAEELAPPPRVAMPLLVRPIVAARALAEYGGLLLFPWHLQVERDAITHLSGNQEARMTMAAWRELQTLLGLLLAAAGLYALWRSRRRPAVFLPLLLAAVCFLPMSGLFLTLEATVAEHWLYLPSAFLFLGAAAAVASLGMVALARRSRVIAAVVLSTWLVCLSARNFSRTFDWKDERTFFVRTVTSGGDSAPLWLALAGLELNKNHPAAARAAVGRALARGPGNPRAKLDLAAVEMAQGHLSQARDILNKISEPPEMQARAQESLVLLENRESGKVDLMRLRLATRLGAPNWSIEKRYLKALADIGSPERALAELQNILNLAPYRAESWEMMSLLLIKLGRPNEAAAALKQAEWCDVHLHQRAVLLL